MDMLTIKTKFMRKLLSELIGKIIYKQLGKEVFINLTDVEFGHHDNSEVLTLKVNGEISMSTKTFEELIKGAL